MGGNFCHGMFWNDITQVCSKESMSFGLLPPATHRRGLQSDILNLWI